MIPGCHSALPYQETSKIASSETDKIRNLRTSNLHGIQCSPYSHLTHQPPQLGPTCSFREISCFSSRIMIVFLQPKPCSERNARRERESGPLTTENSQPGTRFKPLALPLGGIRGSRPKELQIGRDPEHHPTRGISFWGTPVLGSIRICSVSTWFPNQT